MKAFVLAATAAMLVSAVASAETVNVTSPSGQFTNNGSTNAAGPGVGFDSWFANNVRAGGAAGITDKYARSTGGSVQLSGPANAKADFEYYFSASSQFRLSDLSDMSYDYYRASESTATAWLVPALRVYVTNGTNSGYLVFEPIYNGQNASPTDTWVSANISNARVWGTGNLPGAFNDYSRTFADWSALLPDLRVTALSFGIGSGWNGSFDGAVDNVSFTVRGNATTFDFGTAAAAVPEPATWAMMLVGFGMVAGATRYRRRSTATTYA